MCCPDTRISGITYEISHDDYFTTVTSHFCQIYDGGAGDGFSVLRFHFVKEGDTEEEFISKCVRNPKLLVLTTFFAVFEGEAPKWNKLFYYREIGDKMLISLPELISLKDDQEEIGYEI